MKEDGVKLMVVTQNISETFRIKAKLQKTAKLANQLGNRGITKYSQVSQIFRI